MLGGETDQEEKEVKMPRKTTALGATRRQERNIRELIGRRIAQRRATLGISQADLAERFGVSRTAMSQYETGASDPNAGDIPFLAEILGVPVTYFFIKEVSEDDWNMRNMMAHVSSRLPFLPEREQTFILDMIDVSHARLNHDVTFPARKTKRAPTQDANKKAGP